MADNFLEALAAFGRGQDARAAAAKAQRVVRTCSDCQAFIAEYPRGNADSAALADNLERAHRAAKHGKQAKRRR